jgi:hypothetical protein
MTRSLIQRLEGAHDQTSADLKTHISQLITHNS